VFDSWAEHHRSVGRAIVVEELMAAVKENRQPVLSAEHARHALEIMLKSIESARSGRALDLTTTF
jgi:predicted dehydrogenase